MDLPQSEFEALPLTLEQCVAAHGQHMDSPASERLHLWSDFLILGYMKWPNDPGSRSDWLAANVSFHRTPGQLPAHPWLPDPPPFGPSDDFRVLFRAFQHLVEEGGDYKARWRRTAEVLQTVVDIAADHRAHARGTASISKAIALLECDREQPGRSQLAQAWSEFRDVAHLLAAQAYLLRQRDNRTASVASAPLLILAAAYQDFGLKFKSRGQNEPLLSPETLWRVPTWLSSGSIKAPPTKPLRNDQIRFLSERRARKKTARRLLIG
jgi:hypothetical protein